MRRDQKEYQQQNRGVKEALSKMHWIYNRTVAMEVGIRKKLVATYLSKQLTLKLDNAEHLDNLEIEWR